MIRIGQRSQSCARAAQSTDSRSTPSLRSRAPAALAAARLRRAKVEVEPQHVAVINFLIGRGSPNTCATRRVHGYDVCEHVLLPTDACDRAAALPGAGAGRRMVPLPNGRGGRRDGEI